MDGMRKIILTLIIFSFMSVGLGRVHLEIQNVDTDAGTLDIYMTSQTSCSYCDNEIYNYWPNTTSASYWYSNVEGCTSSGNQFFWSDTAMSEQGCQDINGLWFDGDVWGIEFFIDGLTVTGLSNGTASEYFDFLDFNSNFDGMSKIIGAFIFNPTPIPIGEDVLVQVEFENSEDVICLPNQYGCGLSIGNCNEENVPYADIPITAHDTIWLPFIFTTVGECYSQNDTWVYGCTYETATNYNAEATFDDGSCEFLWGDMNHDGTLNIQDIIFLVNAILSGDWF